MTYGRWERERASDDQIQYVPLKKGKEKLKNENLCEKNGRKVKRSLGEEYTSARAKKELKKVFSTYH